jgi:hypothetical protein
MSTKTPIRTDGTFGKLYTKTQDVRSVVKLYRKRTRASYKTAWKSWFKWAMKESK